MASGLTAASSLKAAPRVLVQGVGGIGGVVCARLTEAGADLTPVTGNPQIAEVLNREGFDLEEQGVRRRVALRSPAYAAPPPDGGPWDWIVLVTQNTRLREALALSAPRLAPQGRVLCLQNGLPEPHAAELVPAERVLGAVVSWAASMPEPGRYVRTTRGSIQVGRPGGEADDAVREAVALLAPCGEVRATDNLLGVRWSKLALNSTITTMGAVGGDRLGVLVREDCVRDLAIHIFSETVDVCAAMGVRLEKVSGTFDLGRVALPPAQRARPAGWAWLWRHALLRAIGARYGQARSSMLYALERGRPPEVDYLNGEIVRAGQHHGVPTPANAALVELVHALAAGRLQHGVEHLRALRDRLREG